jgi:uncharacterized protein (TIGR03067 family)
MTAMQAIGTLVLTVLLSGCAYTETAFDRSIDLLPATPTGDYLRLQGTWVVVHNELRTMALPQMKGRLFIFERDRFRLDTDTGSERYAIDESTEPKRIDFDDGRSPLIRGIYTVDAENLVICAAAPGKRRPTEFKTGLFSGDILTKLKKR